MGCDDITDAINHPCCICPVKHLLLKKHLSKQVICFMFNIQFLKITTYLPVEFAPVPAAYVIVNIVEKGQNLSISTQW